MPGWQPPQHFCVPLHAVRDMVLYVTHSSPSGSNEWEEYKGVVDKYWGALATYIPADQIARVEIRRVRATNDE